MDEDMDVDMKVDAVAAGSGRPGSWPRLRQQFTVCGSIPG
jgi:hypothetical protein